MAEGAVDVGDGGGDFAEDLHGVRAFRGLGVLGYGLEKIKGFLSGWEWCL